MAFANLRQCQMLRSRVYFVGWVLCVSHVASYAILVLFLSPLD